MSQKKISKNLGTNVSRKFSATLARDIEDRRPDSQDKMERTEFIKIAPEYYMLAIVMHCQKANQFYTDASFLSAFNILNGNSYQCVVGNLALRREALRRLVSHGAIELHDDPFGPSLWKRTDSCDAFEKQLGETSASPFYKARMYGDRQKWLHTALINLDNAASKLRITQADFEGEPVDEWEPIEIDQGHPSVQEAVQRLQETTAAIEQDNGYAATYPQERDQVVHDLKGGLGKFKSNAISVAWIRRTVEALKIAGARFANTAKTPMIDGTLAAIKEVVKAHAQAAFERIWSLLF